jgi:protein-L-isoaspartate O-methyltransferase
MIIPEGERDEVQRLTLIEKDAQGKVRTTELLPVRFVPLLRGSK